MNDAAHVMQRCDALGQISEEAGRLTRRFASDALVQADALVAEWMRAAGMDVRVDPVGNLIGRYAAEYESAPTLLLGSHLDSVRDAGKYDGPLGVLVALACVERLFRANRRLHFAIELIAFADEEGTRYHTAYLGSSAFTGCFDAALLERIDSDGIVMADAICAAGGDPQRIAEAAWKGPAPLGYLEVHIEQGPVLEARNLPVAVVSGIAGQSRITITFRGIAGHAGTVPMALRHDALCAAAELILAIETVARTTDGLVATVGQLTVEPGASNVIPSEVTLSLDLRHQSDAVRTEALASLQSTAERIARERQVRLDWQLLQEYQAMCCDQGLCGILEEAIAALSYPTLRLPSGAGHDAVMLAHIAPVAMLFVRCAGGISHNPAESVLEEDVSVAIDVLSQALEMLNDE